MWPWHLRVLAPTMISSSVVVISARPIRSLFWMSPAPHVETPIPNKHLFRFAYISHAEFAVADPQSTDLDRHHVIGGKLHGLLVPWVDDAMHGE